MTRNVAMRGVSVLLPWRLLRVLTRLRILIRRARFASRTSLPICQPRMSSHARRQGDGLVGMPSTLACDTRSAEAVMWSCSPTRGLRSGGAQSAEAHECASCSARLSDVRCTLPDAFLHDRSRVGYLPCCYLHCRLAVSMRLCSRARDAPCLPATCSPRTLPVTSSCAIGWRRVFG